MGRFFAIFIGVFAAVGISMVLCCLVLIRATVARSTLTLERRVLTLEAEVAELRTFKANLECGWLGDDE